LSSSIRRGNPRAAPRTTDSISSIVHPCRVLDILIVPSKRVRCHTNILTRYYHPRQPLDCGLGRVPRRLKHWQMKIIYSPLHDTLHVAILRVRVLREIVKHEGTKTRRIQMQEKQPQRTQRAQNKSQRNTLKS
jgi:hypothetical protein